MGHESVASQLIATWQSSNGDLLALKKLITEALSNAARNERRAWLEAMDDKAAGEHVIKSIRTRFPK